MSFGVSDGRGRFEWAARGAARHLRPPLPPRRPAVHPHARRPRPLQPRGAGAASGPTATARRCATSSPTAATPTTSSSACSSPRPRPSGRPTRTRCGASRPRSWPTFFDNHGVLQIRNRPRWRSIPGGSRRYVEALTAPFARADPALDPGAAHRARAPAAISIVTDDGAPSASTRSCSPPTPTRRWRCSATRPRRPSARCSGRSPTPAQRGRPPHRREPAAAAPQRAGRAGTTTCSTTRPATSTVTYDMNRLQSLGTARAVPGDAEPDGGDRPCQDHQGDRLRPSGLHERRHGGAGSLGRDQRSRPGPLLRRLLALGLPRGRRLVGAARLGGARRARARGPRASGPESSEAALSGGPILEPA